MLARLFTRSHDSIKFTSMMHMATQLCISRKTNASESSSLKMTMNVIYTTPHQKQQMLSHVAKHRVTQYQRICEHGKENENVMNKK